MSSFVKKLMATGAALSIGISSFAVADYYNLNNNCCPPPCCDPCANWCDNLSFNAAWLYWKASGDDFQYAIEKRRFTSGTTTEATLFTSEEKYHDVKFDWDSGFRIGVGLDLPCKGWGVDVNWTHYDTNSSSKTLVQGESTIAQTISAGFPVLNDFNDTITEDESVEFKGLVKFRYNVVDIEFGKWCCCGCVQFRPHAGFRAADIKEHFKDAFRGIGGATLDGYSSAFWHHENRFKGFGVRTGLDVDFCLCEGWSIIGRGALSAIWGRTHLKNRLALSTDTAVGIETSFIKEDFRQTRFMADLSLGVRYRTVMCGCYPLTTELSWDFRQLFAQHRYWVDDNFDNADTTGAGWRSTGDVTLQGLTLSFSVAY